MTFKEIVLRLVIFSLAYWLYSSFAFVIYYFRAKKQKMVKDIPGYSIRLGKVKSLIEEMGCKMVRRTKLPLIGIISIGGATFFKRIFISENILRKLDFDELLYVVYHEVGHIKLNHPNKLAALFVVQLFLFAFISISLRLENSWFAILFALIFGNIDLYFGRRYEDEADLYALVKIGFESVEKGILAMHRLNDTSYDYDFLQGYFDVHRTHLARIDRLRAKSEGR